VDYGGNGGNGGDASATAAATITLGSAKAGPFFVGDLHTARIGRGALRTELLTRSSLGLPGGAARRPAAPASEDRVAW